MTANGSKADSIKAPIGGPLIPSKQRQSLTQLLPAFPVVTAINTGAKRVEPESFPSNLAVSDSLIAFISRRSGSLKAQHHERMLEAKRQTIYLNHIMLHASVSNSELIPEKKEKWLHHLDAELKSVGLDEDAAFSI